MIFHRAISDRLWTTPEGIEDYLGLLGGQLVEVGSVDDELGRG